MTTVTTDRPTTTGIALARRAQAILTLAEDCADANRERCKTGLPVKLWDGERRIIAGLLPHLEPEHAQEVLVEVIDWVFRSREDGMGDSDIEACLESGRDRARDAIAADIAAGAA